MQLAHPSNLQLLLVCRRLRHLQPGEPLADFKHRLSTRDYDTRTRGVELMLDKAPNTRMPRRIGTNALDQPENSWQSTKSEAV